MSRLSAMNLVFVLKDFIKRLSALKKKIKKMSTEIMFSYNT